MTDSTPEILKKQLEIILSKSESERFRIGDELNTFGRKVLENSIRYEYPGISDMDLKIEVFKRIYTPFYSTVELDRIILSIRDYMQKEMLIAGVAE